MRISKVVAGAALALCLGCGGGKDAADIASSAQTSTTEAPTTTAEPSTTSVSTTRAPSTTTVRRSTTSTVRVTTTRGAASPLPSSTTAPAGQPPCSPALLSVEVTTDKATYRPGETVRVTATLRNRSGASCFYKGYTGTHRFEGPGGQPTGRNSAFIADAFRDVPLAAGATLTQSPTWDQRSCPAGPVDQCAQALPGTYSVTVGWGFGGAPAEGSATFGLVTA